MSRLDIRRRNERRQTKKNLPEVGLVIFLMLLAAFVLAVFLVGKNYNFLGNTTGIHSRDVIMEPNVVCSVSYQADLTYGYMPYNDSVLVYGSSGVKAISSDGDTEWEVALGLSSPFICVADNYILLADKGGKQVYILNRDKLILASKTQYAILDASITPNGTFVTVTDEPYYKGLVTVKNLHDEEVFVWHSGNGYVVDAVLSDDGKRLAVATMNAENKLEAGVLFFNVSETQAYQTYAYENCLIGSLYNDASQSVLAVADDRLLCFDAKGAQSWRYDYAGKSIEKIAHSRTGVSALALSSGSADSGEICVIDSKGRQVASAKPDGKIRYLTMYADKIAYNDGGSIAVGDTGSLPLYKIKQSKDLRDVVLFAGAKCALGAGNVSLDIMRIK